MDKQQIYRIKNWDSLYEKNRTRGIQNMKWVAIPANFESDGYTLIMSKKNGPAIFGAWVACVFLASKCRVRGTLMRTNNTPHNIESISRITRVPEVVMKEMITVCLCECNWLETITMHDNARKPHENAGQTHLSVPTLHNITIQKKEKLDKKKESRIFPEDLKKSLVEFKKMRTKIKRPLTERAEEMLFAKLSKLSDDESVWCKILDQSTYHCWQGVFELKINDDAKTNSKSISEQFEEQKNGKNTVSI